MYRALIIAFIYFVEVNSAYAFSAVATIKGHVNEAWQVVYNYENQNDANKAALKGCKAEAKKNGIGKLANQCKIVNQGKIPGYGAIVCGNGGCAWVLELNSAQAAVNAAYEKCAGTYMQCQSQNITHWNDFRGFNKKNNEPVMASDNKTRPQNSRFVNNSINSINKYGFDNGFDSEEFKQSLINSGNTIDAYSSDFRSGANTVTSSTNEEQREIDRQAEIIRKQREQLDKSFQDSWTKVAPNSESATPSNSK